MSSGPYQMKFTVQQIDKYAGPCDADKRPQGVSSDRVEGVSYSLSAGLALRVFPIGFNQLIAPLSIYTGRRASLPGPGGRRILPVRKGVSSIRRQ